MPLSERALAYAKRKGIQIGNSPSQDLPNNPQETVQEKITRYANQYGIPVDLALAQAKQESGYRTDAVSPKGAYGVMQLMPATAKSLGVDPRDPDQNIEGGMRLMSTLRKKYGSDKLALAAYHAGEGAVDKYHGVPPYPETQNYVKLADNLSNTTQSPASTSSAPPQPLSERSKAYAKKRGIKYPGYVEEPSLMDMGKNLADKIYSTGENVRTGTRDLIANIPGQIKKKLTLDKPSSSPAIQTIKNNASDLIDVGVGFPAQVVSGALNLPEEIKGYIDNPQMLKEAGKETLDILKAPYTPSNFTYDQYVKHPFSTLALAAQQLAPIAPIARGFKSLKKAPLPNADMSHLYPDVADISRFDKPMLPEAPQPAGLLEAPGFASRRVFEPQGPGKAFTSDAPEVLQKETFQNRRVIPEIIEHNREAPIVKSTGGKFSPENDSLMDFVRKSGGINTLEENMRGDIKRIGSIKEAGYNLVNNKGVGKSLDYLREISNEVGFGPFDTVSDFVDALDSDLMGKKNKSEAGRVWSNQKQNFEIENINFDPTQFGYVPKVKDVTPQYPDTFSAKVSPENIPKIKSYKSLKKPVIPSEVIPEQVQILPEKLSEKVQETTIKRPNLRLAKTTDLIKDVLAGFTEKLGEERGSISSKKAEGENARAAESARELFRRLSDEAKKVGISIEEVAAKYGFDKQSFQQAFLLANQHKVEGFKDLKPLQTQYKTFERGLEAVTGKNYPEYRENLVVPREKAVNSLIGEVSNYKKEIKNYIVKELGIKSRSKESAATMKFGEGRMNLADLKKQFPQKWQNIVKADEYFRQNYDKILNETNKVLASMGKDQIPRRNDYYTHVQEIGNLWNDLVNPAAIDPQLAGISEFTRPTSKWNPFAQKRKGGAFLEDAVEAFDRYLMPTLSQKHLSPIIKRYRMMADSIAEQTLKSKDLNNFIGFLHDHANALAGKTNPMDRFIQDKVLGRKITRLIDWTAQRLGANSIVGNLSSALMQTASLPVSTAHAGLFNTLKGYLGTVVDAMAGKNKAMEMSDFLKRRYSDVDPIHKSLLRKGLDVAATPLKIFEEFMVEGAWRSNFNKAMSEFKNMKEAIKEADFETERQIGGRAIGEKPLMFQSRVGNLMMQFQLEVNNLLQRYGHDLGLRKKTEAVKIMVYSFLFNQVMEQLLNRRPLLDPLNAAYDAATQEKDKKDSVAEDILKRVGRLGGEFLSNAPGGQSISTLIPENTRKKYLGRTEVGIYGGGPPIISTIQRGIKKPESLITSFGTPFGGSQISKSYRGLKAIKDNPDLSTAKKIQAVTFGPYAAGLVEKKKKHGKGTKFKKQKGSLK